MSNQDMKNDDVETPAQQAKAEPIRRLRDIKAIKLLLKDNPRNAALFTLGINTNLMPNELLQLKVRDVVDLDFNESVDITDEKTGKVTRSVVINRISLLAIRGLLESDTFAPDDFLFKSQRGNSMIQSLHRLVTKWCDAVGLQGNFGSHTLRKTWGYHQNHTFGVEVSALARAFNHASQKQTREYLGLNEEEEVNLFLHEL